MGKIKLKKISDLQNIESFMQIDLFKGYKYVDKAGEIVNYFYNDKKEPLFTMDLNGLIIHKPSNEIETLKVSAKVFWAHFISPDSLDQIKNWFSKNSTDILNILSVNKITRLGWRNYFVYDFIDIKQRDAVFNKYLPNENFRTEEFMFSTQCKDLDLNIKIQKIKKKDKIESPGILIDIDMFKLFKEPLSVNLINNDLNNFIGTIRSEDFLEIINSILRPDDKNNEK